MNTKKGMWMFFFGAMIFHIAANLVHPVTPTLIVERQLDSSMFGVALAAMLFANFAFAPFWGQLCSYIPTKMVLLICSLGYAVGQVIFGISTTEPIIIGGRLFSGIFAGGIFTALSNYVINTTTDISQRGKNLTILVTIQNVCSAIGYFIGGMVGLISVEAAFGVQCAFLVFEGIFMYATCQDDTLLKHKPEKRLSVKAVNPFRAMMSAKEFTTPMLALLFVIVAIAGIGQNSFEQCFNYYIKDQFQLSSAYNGIFKAIIAVVNLICNSTICIWMMKKTNTNLSFVPIVGLSAVTLGAILCFDAIVPFVIVDVVFFTLNAIRLPLLQNLCASRATAENSNAVMGFFQSMTSMGGIFGALFAGLIYDANPVYPFVLAFAALALATAFSVIYVKCYRRECR